jgi:hypothetical protein
MRGINSDGNKRALRRLGFAAGLVVVLAPISAHADGMINSGVVTSWLDMVTASEKRTTALDDPFGDCYAPSRARVALGLL